MKKIFLLVLLVFIAVKISAQTQKQNIYSGGMLFFQPGYLNANNNHQQIKEISMGIGGILRFYFFKNFNAGIYGGTQKSNYKTQFSDNSYINIGYGGAFLGLSKKIRKIRLNLSIYGGKGSINNLHIENQNNNFLTNAYLYKSPTTIFSPIISLDYSLTERISATLQFVFLNSKFQSKHFSIPIVQLGILFNR